MGVRAQLPQEPDAPRLLASVATLAEVDLALAAGADLIDLKDPAGRRARCVAAGAIDAGRRARRRAATRQRHRGRSAAGRRRASPRRRRRRPPQASTSSSSASSPARTTARWPGPWRPLAAGGIRLVAVLMADQGPDLAIASTLAEAGFTGVMLDTADKRSGSLLRHLDVPALGAFVATARGHGLVTGLAGSLRLEDVAHPGTARPRFPGVSRCPVSRRANFSPRPGAVRRSFGASSTQRTRRDPEGNTCHSGPAANIVTR